MARKLKELFARYLTNRRSSLFVGLVCVILAVVVASYGKLNDVAHPLDTNEHGRKFQDNDNVSLASSGRHRVSGLIPMNLQEPAEQVSRILSSQPGRLQRLQAAFSIWGQDHPELSDRLIGLIAARLGGKTGVGVQSWNESELRSGIALVLQGEEFQEMLPFFAELAGRLAEINPHGALEMVESSQATSRDKAQLLGEILAGWMRKDSTGAVQWACARPSGSQRENILEHVVQNLVQEDPEKAAEIVAMEFESPEAEANSVRTVVGRWMHLDPSATVNWLIRFPVSTLRSEMLQVAVSSWNTMDRDALVGWIDGLPADDFRIEVEAVSRQYGDTALRQNEIPTP